MKNDRCFRAGPWGSLGAAICCATPILPFILGIIGLAVFTPFLDYVLFPLLGLFVILTLYGWRQQKRSC